MYGQLVKSVASDGVVLDGFYNKLPKSRIAVLHVHGTAGSFYGNDFIGPLYNQLEKIGCSFLSCNNRGNGRFTMMTQKKPDGTSTRRQIGAAYELFIESMYDINGWVEFLLADGYEKIFLEGHSVGCHKVLYFMEHSELCKHIAGVILLSPSDILGWQKSHFQQRFANDLQAAHQLIKEGKGDSLMPLEAYVVPVSAKTFISFLAPQSEAHIFNYHDQESSFKELNKVTQPIFATFGTVGEIVVSDPGECAVIFKKNTRNSSNCKTQVIDGAPHSYAGYEDVLVSQVGQWIKSNT